MNEPKKIQPLPPGLLDKLDKHERWLYETVFDGVQKTERLIEHSVKADEHRIYINKEVSDTRSEVAELTKKVQPAVQLAARFSTLKGKSIAAGFALAVIAITAALTEWVKSIFKP